MTWNVSPWVARNYLKAVVKQFEAYARTNYLPALSRPKATPSTLLAALTFLRTRDIHGYDATLDELFTSPRGARPEIAEACLDAMIATGESPESTARFLAAAATDERLSMSMNAERGLFRLRPESVDAVFDELLRPYDGRRLRKIARLVTRLTNVQPDVPIKFWESTGPDARADAITRWSRAMYLAGVWKGQ